MGQRMEMETNKTTCVNFTSIGRVWQWRRIGQRVAMETAGKPTCGNRDVSAYVLQWIHICQRLARETYRPKCGNVDV